MTPTIDEIRLVRLSPVVNQIDFAAIMGSRVRLRKELRWVRGWPRDDFTLEENRKDLERHDSEFSRGEAYAYSVLDPDGTTCIGCLYIGSWQQAVTLSFWVVDAVLERGLETRLLTAVLEWLGAQWDFDRVLVPLRAENTRCIELARKLGMRTIDKGGIDEHVNLLWMR